MRYRNRWSRGIKTQSVIAGFIGGLLGAALIERLDGGFLANPSAGLAKEEPEKDLFQWITENYIRKLMEELDDSIRIKRKEAGT